MRRNYYSSSPTALEYAATGDSSSGGGSGSGMECLQLRSPPAPFHYHISDQAKSLVALQELQNEVGALLEFRDLVIETFPNLRSKLANGSGGGSSVGSSSGTGAPVVSVSTRRDWDQRVRVRRKVPPRESDSLPRSRSDSHSKPPAKSEGAHSVIQDSGFSTETSSSKEAHSTATPSTRQPAPYEVELWQLLDVIQIRGSRLRDEAEALRGSIIERRSHSLNALSDPEPDDDNEPSEEFRRALATVSIDEVVALRRERDLLLDRLSELEAETLAGRVEAERLRKEGNIRLGLDHIHEFGERVLDLRSRPSAPGPLRSPLIVGHNSVFAPVTPVKSVNSAITDTPRRGRCPPGGSDSDGEGDVSSAFDTDLGKLDKVMNTPVRNLKVKTPDSRKFTAILQENNLIELRRHLLKCSVHNQILQDKLDKIGRSKGTLVERLHRTREENDDLRFQLEEKTIELEGTKAHMRLLENGGRRPSCSGAPRSMRALQPLPLYLQDAEDPEPDTLAEPENERITDTPRRRPSKIPLPPSKQSISSLNPKPPTGRSKETPSYRSRSGDSLGRSSSAQSWRNKSDSLTGSKSGNSITSTKCASGCRNSGFTTLKSSSKDSFGRSRDFKSNKDSLTGRVRNNDSLSRIRDSNLSNSSSAISKSGKKDSSNSSNSGKKSSVPVRRASSSGNARLSDSDAKAIGVFHNPWKRTGVNGNRLSYTDSLDSEQPEQETVQNESEDRRLLHDFVVRSNKLAKDKRILYLNSDLYHNRIEDVSIKEETEYAYESPIPFSNMHLNNSYSNPRDYLSDDLVTMDISTLHNKPTRSDVTFFNQPLYHSYQSIWNRQSHCFFDSITNSALLDSNYCSTLQSITNDSIKREGLAECDSIDRKISMDDVV